MEPIAAVGSPISGSQENGGNVTQPRAADDFPMIRARMEELRRERVRPRAADDFATIRARMEELRRERAQGLRSRLCRHRQSRDPARGTGELERTSRCPRQYPIPP